MCIPVEQGTSELKGRVKSVLKTLSERLPRLYRFYMKYRSVRTIHKRFTRNKPDWQRKHWAAALDKESSNHTATIGYRWGNPINENDRLGNYRHVLDLLRSKTDPSTTILEIGCYGGKWTERMVGVQKIICVDLFDESFEFIRNRFKDGYNLEFYRTRGDELEGVGSETVDLIFSMDSLVRAPRRAIRNYFKEMHRVLRSGGEVVVHLPCQDSPMSVGMYFTSLSRGWIERVVTTSGFSRYSIDDTTLKHGLLVLGKKD